MRGNILNNKGVIMLALVKLKKKRNNRIYEFLDYISYDVAKIGVDIQGVEHSEGEYSRAEIVKVIKD